MIGAKVDLLNRCHVNLLFGQGRPSLECCPG